MRDSKFDLKKYVNDVADFPIAGVTFRDISPLLANSAVFAAACDAMVSEMDLNLVDHFVGVESRGFILGAALAQKFQKGFVPLRKAGKLPPPVQSKAYSLEYGQATLEMHRGHGRVVVIDDVLATGGTLQASLDLCHESGFEVQDVAVLIDLRSMNQFRFRGRAVRSAIQY